MKGNKSNLFDQEKISEVRAKNLAKEVGAKFRYISAKESIGIKELFICFGCKFLDPNYVDDGNKLPRTNLIKKEDDKNRSEYIKRRNY